MDNNPGLQNLRLWQTQWTNGTVSIWQVFCWVHFPGQNEWKSQCGEQLTCRSSESRWLWNCWVFVSRHSPAALIWFLSDTGGFHLTYILWVCLWDFIGLNGSSLPAWRISQGVQVKIKPHMFLIFLDTPPEFRTLTCQWSKKRRGGQLIPMQPGMAFQTSTHACICECNTHTI